MFSAATAKPKRTKQRITASKAHLRTVTYDKYAPARQVRFFLVLHLLGAFRIMTSDIATSLQFWEGHPHPNENSFRAFLLTECAYSEREPQGGEIANAELDVQYK